MYQTGVFSPPSKIPKNMKKIIKFHHLKSSFTEVCTVRYCIWSQHFIFAIHSSSSTHLFSSSPSSFSFLLFRIFIRIFIPILLLILILNPSPSLTFTNFFKINRAESSILSRNKLNERIYNPSTCLTRFGLFSFLFFFIPFPFPFPFGIYCMYYDVQVHTYSTYVHT